MRVVILGDERLPFEACLWAGGFVVPDVVRQSGLPVNARGQVLVELYLRALGHEHIHVIGDAASPVRPPSSLLMGCKIAMPMGAYVISFETDGEHIHAIRSVLNPEELARV